MVAQENLSLSAGQLFVLLHATGALKSGDQRA